MREEPNNCSHINGTNKEYIMDIYRKLERLSKPNALTYPGSKDEICQARSVFQRIQRKKNSLIDKNATQNFLGSILDCIEQKEREYVVSKRCDTITTVDYKKYNSSYDSKFLDVCSSSPQQHNNGYKMSTSSNSSNRVDISHDRIRSIDTRQRKAIMDDDYDDATKLYFKPRKLVNHRIECDFSSSLESYHATTTSGATSQQQRDDLINNRHKCVVCLSKEKEYVFVPCGHMCVCKGCGEKILQDHHHRNELCCPVCRAPADTVIKVYI